MTPEQFLEEHDGLFRGALRWGMKGTRREEWDNIRKLAFVALQAACEEGVEEPIEVARYISRLLTKETRVVHTQREETDSLDEQGESASETESAEDSLIRHEEKTSLYQAIEQLPESHRTVVVLRLKEVPWAEVAEKMGVSRQMAQYRYAQAEVALKAMLNPDISEDNKDPFVIMQQYPWDRN